jgi:hypothetical protein
MYQMVQFLTVVSKVPSEGVQFGVLLHPLKKIVNSASWNRHCRYTVPDACLCLLSIRRYPRGKSYYRRVLPSHQLHGDLLGFFYFTNN